jgi:N-hydroxyarylamine O-acetyltransferase
VDGGGEMNSDDYLLRIGLGGREISLDHGGLSLLQRQHLLHVPFENLDIHWNRPIVLDTERFYKKIVVERRGGFCYELNGLFNELLTNLGFKTRIVSARVFNGSVHGPEFDHAAIIVTIGEDEYLADVGFGDFTAEPLRFVIDEEQTDATGTFVIRRFDDDYLEAAKRDGDGFKSEYIFKDISRDLSEFSEMCDFQQFSPESHFTKGKVCSLMTADGRKSLTDKKYIITSGNRKDERGLESENEFYSLLKSEFNIVASM